LAKFYFSGRLIKLFLGIAFTSLIFELAAFIAIFFIPEDFQTIRVFE